MPEQRSAEPMIEMAWKELKRRTLSQSALYVLWGSVTSAEDLTERYLTAKGERHLLIDAASSVRAKKIDLKVPERQHSKLKNTFNGLAASPVIPYCGTSSSGIGLPSRMR